MEVITIAAIVTLLIAINALYVAAEFSAVSARRSRLSQLAESGNRPAAYILRQLEDPHNLDTYIAACQLGITASSLVLGLYGQSRIMRLVEPYIETMSASAQLVLRSATATAILIVLTITQVILGELIPKNVAIQYPERLAIATAAAMRWSVVIFDPLIRIFNGSGQLILRMFGATQVAGHGHVHSPKEIEFLVEESSEGGVLDEEERRLLVNTLQLRNLTARKVMIPRNRIVAAPIEKSVDEDLELLARSPYSRLPIYRESIDAIVGIVHIKDLLSAKLRTLQADESEPAPPMTVESLMHPVLYIPESAPVEEVMDTMQQARLHVAVVVDEYGGTAGMITFEDLVEEIIGEFQDEFDVENPPVELRGGNRVRVRGDVLIEDINDLLNLNLPTEDADTLGGLVLTQSGRIPAVGEILTVNDIDLRVDRVVDNSVAAVSLKVTPDQAERLRARGSAL